MIDTHRIQHAYQTVRRDLLATRVKAGHWEGRLADSALSTAVAISALSAVARHTARKERADACRSLAARGIEWLVVRQNADGGWGDTDKSLSNIATTMLVRAALHMADVADQHTELLSRAEAYIEREGGIAALRRRYEGDKTFAVPILTNCAIAGLVPWKEVSPLPFEMACLPHSALRFCRLPVVSYAIPALVAIGQARFFHRCPRNPLMYAVRRASVLKSLKALERMQPTSGGYLEAVPLTSFVIMSLASTGRADHPVVGKGLRFLWASVRENGS